MKSSLHNDLQNYLLALFQEENPKAEVTFSEINRKADIVIEAKKLVIEVQVSSISKREVKARNSDYRNLGYHVIWILHFKKFGRLFPSRVERYLQRGGMYYTDFHDGRGHFYDTIRIKSFGKQAQLFEVDLSELYPFIHTSVSRLLKPNARYCCHGDAIHTLITDPEYSLNLYNFLFPWRRSWKKLLYKKYDQWLDRKLAKHLEYDDFYFY